MLKVFENDDLLAEILANDKMSRANACKLAARFRRTSTRCNDDELWKAIAAKMGIETFIAEGYTYRELVDQFCKIIRLRHEFYEALEFAVMHSKYELAAWIVENSPNDWNLYSGEEEDMVKFAVLSGDMRLLRLVYGLLQRFGRRYFNSEADRLRQVAKKVDHGLYWAVKNKFEDKKGADAILEFCLQKGSTTKGYHALQKAFGINDLATLKHIIQKGIPTRKDVKKLVELIQINKLTATHIELYNWLLRLLA